MISSNEWIFRVVFGVLWLVYFGVRLYYQGRVKGMGEYVKVNEKQEKQLFRLFALAYLLMAVYFLTGWVDFAHFVVPAWLRWMGAVITCGGIGLFTWAHQTLGLNWTAILALSDKHQLVTDGPYARIRHPMYSAFYIIGIGFGLLSANWLVALVYLGTLTVMYLARVAKEEEMMLARFGEAYRQHIEKTGRLWPRL